MTKTLSLALLALAIGLSHADDNPAVAAMQDYLDFADYGEGSISTEQLASIESTNILYIDTRNPAQYDSGHIPGALNIEWRLILARRAEIPTDRPVVLYCDTGLLSSKAQFSLKIAGRDNIKVLWGGYLMWLAGQDSGD
mgnify:FL=1